MKRRKTKRKFEDLYLNNKGTIYSEILVTSTRAPEPMHGDAGDEVGSMKCTLYKRHCFHLGIKKNGIEASLLLRF